MTIETVRWAHSTCPHDCPSTCALEVEVLDSKTIGRVRGRKGHAYTDGVICGKVSRYADRVNHPQRLMHPLKRVGPKGVGMESFTPISWEQALDETAAAFKGAAQEFGSESVWPYFYAGTMGHVQRDGIERLRHEMRYSGQHSTFCVTLADAGWNAGTGRKRGTAGREIADCELLVVWGGNPVNTQINVMHKFQQARRSRNAKLVVIDPYCTDTADKADLFLNLRPGTDGALACAVMHVLFEEDYADWDYLERFTDCPTELREHLKSRDPQWASERTGIPVSQILEFARLYGSTRQAFIRIGYGFTRSRNGATAMHSVSSLPAVTGAWKYRGGGALYGNTELYLLDKTMICGLDLIDPKIRILDQSRIGAVLCGDATDIGEGPPVKAMLIQNTNPMMVAPDTNKIRQGFMREDLFVCVHEQFMTETAAMADIVLPATSFLEHDDYYTASGHTYLQISPAVIEAPGECRSNHEVLQQLGQRLGAKHPGFQMSSWELVMRTLEDSGFEEGHNLERRSFEIDFEPGFETSHYLDGFEHPDGRFHFRADWNQWPQAAEGMPQLPDQWQVTDEATSEKPFRLVTAPARWFLNSTFTELEISRKRLSKPRVKLHPQDCQEQGLSSGQVVRLGNDRGEVELEVEPFGGMQTGVAVVESIWPNGAFRNGHGINTLTSAEAAAPNGGAVYHDTAVWVRPVD